MPITSDEWIAALNKFGIDNMEKAEYMVRRSVLDQQLRAVELQMGVPLQTETDKALAPIKQQRADLQSAAAAVTEQINALVPPA